MPVQGPMLSGEVETVIDHSVTKSDALRYRGGIPTVMYFNFPTWGELPRITDLPPEPPPYWTPARDATLRNTILFETFWGAAVAIAATKAASTSFEISGDVPLRVQRAQQLMLQWDGRQGYVAAQEKGVQDFTCTDNGEFHEIVRLTRGYGSKIVGLVHLDARRCLRTGDPDIPIVYRDIMNRYHELRDYQVISMVDEPDPGAAWFGIGHCAAGRAYKQIYKLAALEQYILEKLTSSGATELEFVSGITKQQIDDARDTAKEEKSQAGTVYYQGKIVIPTMADTQVSGYRVPLKGLPDGFDRKIELEIALLAYANALGLVLTDLQPLSGQGLGTGSQTVILEEKAWGRGMAARRKQLTHQLNMWVYPDRTVFAFHERDLREQKTQADIASIAAATRSTMVQVGEITPDQSRQLAVKDGLLPKDFVAENEITFQTIEDEEKWEALPVGTLPPGAAQPLPVNQVPPLQQPTPPTAPIPGQAKPAKLPAPGISTGRNGTGVTKELDPDMARGEKQYTDTWDDGADDDITSIHRPRTLPPSRRYMAVDDSPVFEVARGTKQGHPTAQPPGKPTTGPSTRDNSLYPDPGKGAIPGNPTEAQVRAGNYPKKHVNFHGMQVSIENPKGSVREGTDSHGKKWRVQMKHDYGYIRRTEGTDDMQVDAFMGPKKNPKNVYVVHQNDPYTGKYDEDKVMLGFGSPKKARAAYQAHHDNPKAFGSMDKMPLDQFKDRVLQRASYGKPVTGGAQVSMGAGTYGRGTTEKRSPNDVRQLQPRAGVLPPVFNSSDDMNRIAHGKRGDGPEYNIGGSGPAPAPDFDPGPGPDDRLESPPPVDDIALKWKPFKLSEKPKKLAGAATGKVVSPLQSRMPGGNDGQ